MGFSLTCRNEQSVTCSVSIPAGTCSAGTCGEVLSITDEHRTTG